MTPRTTLLVMAKAPVPGRVKTRLCPPCRPEDAAALAAAALADTLDVVDACGAERRILALDGEPGEWLPAGFEVVAQAGDSFPDRLAAAWSVVDGPCLQIGMDTPQITPALLDHGLDAVALRATAALGPASDGGWWSIGMRHPVPAVFAGVPMSTEWTGVRQVSALRRHGLEPEVLSELLDIDTFDDAREVAALIPRSRTAAQLALIVDRLDRRPSSSRVAVP
jgi:glycosyltransferase A (GT-A) superfamily protein (DUF2064 family)